jgi:peptidyl-prolyl cis-trans isomerase B (cyclophilin B)
MKVTIAKSPAGFYNDGHGRMRYFDGTSWTDQYQEGIVAPPIVKPQMSGTNPLAVVSFVLVFFATVPAIVLGHVALTQIRRTGQGGRGLAIAALMLGYVVTIGGLVGVAIYFYAQAHVGYD